MIFSKMFKHKFIIFIFLCLTGICTHSFAQITLTPANGCAPLSVMLSGPTGATNVFWNLGSGLGTSTLTNPNTLYTSPGTYNITYTAIVAGSPVSHNAQLVVSAGPSANFSYVLPASHCAPMQVNFSTSGGNPGYVYTWAFGDLSPLATGATITHTYNFSNSFVPIVTAFDPVTTCTALVSPSSGGTIHVSTPPSTVVASSNGFMGCTPPFTTHINGSGSSSGSPIPGGNLTYNWSFSGANPSTSGSANPGLVSFGNGVNVITLHLTDNNKCSNSGTVAVSILNPSLAVTIPGTVCLNLPVPATVQTSQAGAFFDIQNEGQFYFPTNQNASTVIDTICFFSTPGTHTINISVQGGAGCAPTIVQNTVFVEEVLPSFTMTPPHISCTPSMAITYVNLSTNNTGLPMNYTWTASWIPHHANIVTPETILMNNMANVTFSMYQNSPNPYTIYDYFIPSITLFAQSTSIAGCKTSTVIVEYDTLARPSAFYNVDVRQGCAPLTVNFRDSSFTTQANYVTSYTWCNGASPPVLIPGTTSPPNSVSIAPQTFTYTSPGVYYPYLVITTLFGCIDTSYVDTIRVVDPPTVSATFPSTACAGMPVTINLTGSGTSLPGSPGIDNWHVTTDEGFFSGCITNQNPSFPFTHPGIHTVVVTAYQANCKGTTTLVPTIEIKGPVGKFQYETTCQGDKRFVKFNVHLQRATTAILDFGDGSSSSTITGDENGSVGVLVTHTYSATGNFTVTLISVNAASSCQYTFSQVIKIREPQVAINFRGQPFPTLPTALSCVNSKYEFGVTSSDAMVSCGRGYLWNFQAPGGMGGSPGYSLYPLDRATPSFSTGFVQFVNFQYSPPKLDTNYHIVDHVSLDTFRVVGIYTISVRVRDENGCMASDTKLFRISNATPIFTFAANPVCKSDGHIQIINTTKNSQLAPDVISNYLWTFGDGNFSSSTDPDNNPTHTYANVFSPSQVFTVVCSVTNAPVGCTGQASRTIQVNNPSPGFSSNNPFPCIPLSLAAPVNFSANTGYATYSVNYGSQALPPAWFTFNGNFNNAVFGYSAPGTYSPVLTVIDNAGCRATETLIINAIGQPTAVIKFENDKTSFCMFADPVISSEPLINVTPVTEHMWTVGNVTPPSQVSITPFFPPGSHFISLTVYANNRCPSTATALVNVYEPNATAFAVAQKTIICLGDPLNVSVKDVHDVYSWQWFFGDNVSQPLIYAAAPNGTLNPAVSYPYSIFPTTGQDGYTTVNLLYFAPENACEMVSTFSIQVIKINADFKTINDVYEHCLNITDRFINITPNPTAQNLETTWSFGEGTILSAATSSALHTYSVPGTYDVILAVKDADFGCTDTVTKQIRVFPSPVANISITPTINCPGKTFTVSGGGTPGVSGTLSATLTAPAFSQVLDLAPANSFSIPVSSTVSTTYSLSVTDDNSCKSNPVSMSVAIVPPAPQIHWDTTVIIGQIVPLNAYVGSGYTYTWSPLVTDLNCDTCFIPNPVSSTTINATYTVLVEDELNCSIVKNTYRVIVDPRVSLDVPSAFTPNGDGINDIIYPSGWGLSKLIYFRVFNRWGQMIFESNDLNIGWDGVFNSVPQNIETYVYQVSAETLSDKEPIITKTGTFKLIR